MPSPDLVADAERGEFLPVYVVAGDSPYLRREALQRLRAAALSGGIPGLNHDEFDGMQDQVRTVLSAARTLPMMATRRVVVLRNLHLIEKNAERAADRAQKHGKSAGSSPLDELAAYAQDPSPSTLLILHSESLDRRRQLYARAQKAGYLVACDTPKRAELTGWTERLARERGYRLARGIADAIAEVAGPDLGAVADAVERLGLFAAGAVIDEDHLAQCLVKARPSRAFDLVDAASTGKLARALELLHQSYDSSEEHQLLGLLAWSARQRLRFASALARGSSPEEAAKIAKAPPFKVRELAAETGPQAVEGLSAWLRALGRVEEELKGASKRPGKSSMEVAIMESYQRLQRRPSAPAQSRRRGP